MDTSQLISKIQYKQFETGEFVEKKPRNYEQTIELIEQFPWESQREHLAIGLTNPSITIHGKNQDYLKLALYYNGKFVLHYIDRTGALFTKSFTDIKGAYPYIENLFEASRFELKDFRKENTVFQHNLKHFLSDDFRYEVTRPRIKHFLISTNGINFAVSFFFILFGLINYRTVNAPGLIVTLFVAFLFGGGINLLFFFNYYRHSKDKVLIMSKGNDVFYYGEKDNLVRYEKGFIMRFIHVVVRNSRNPLSGFALIRMEMKDGTEIVIPNLLVNDLDLQRKLEGIPYVEKGGFPWISA